MKVYIVVERVTAIKKRKTSHTLLTDFCSQKASSLSEGNAIFLYGV